MADKNKDNSKLESFLSFILLLGSMEIAALTPLEDGSFKPQKIEIDNKVDAKAMLAKPKSFVLCTKSCNGNYHPVFSELPNLLKEHKSGSNGMAKEILKELAFDEDMHGQRFIVFKNGGDAYLLGDITNALKKLSK